MRLIQWTMRWTMRWTLISCVMIGLGSCKTSSDTSTVAETADPQIEPLQKDRINDTVAHATAALASALRVTGPNNIPVASPDVLAKTSCIISMQIDRGAFLFGGSGGEGLMSCRVAGGWSAPSFLKTGSFDLGAAIGWERMQTTIFVGDPALVNIWRQGGTFEIRAYARAVAGDNVAALNSISQYGMAVVQISNGGLYAGVGISFSSLSHAQEMRNDPVYSESLGGGTPVDPSGRPCSNYILPGRRNGCIADWERRTGKRVTPVKPAQILATPADSAPALTKPFNDLLRQVP